VHVFNVDALGSRSKTPGKFWNVVLEKDGADIWTDHVRNEEVLLRVKEQKNILHEISKRKANWIGHILLRNYLLRQVIEGKIEWGIEVTGRRGRRRRNLLDVLKESRWHSHMKEKALDCTTRIWSARFGRGFGPIVRQTTKWMNYLTLSIFHAMIDSTAFNQNNPTWNQKCLLCCPPTCSVAVGHLKGGHWRWIGL
jgi:hypothetical protein